MAPRYSGQMLTENDLITDTTVVACFTGGRHGPLLLRARTIEVCDLDFTKTAGLDSSSAQSCPSDV
jgi:hypothetical protein